LTETQNTLADTSLQLQGAFAELKETVVAARLLYKSVRLLSTVLQDKYNENEEIKASEEYQKALKTLQTTGVLMGVSCVPLATLCRRVQRLLSRKKKQVVAC
jgi:hypothetical protein